MRPQVIALVSPGWPAESFSNGIVSYTTRVRSGLQGSGARVFILAAELRATAEEEDVIELRRGWSPSELASRAGWRLFGGWSSRSLDARNAGGRIRRALCRLCRRADVQLLEMEDSFGMACHVARSCPVPLVVRLHGPHFLNGGLAAKLADDARYRWQVRAERAGILAASAVTAPSRDVLERTRQFYEIDLAAAEVIPYPIEPAEPARRWCGPDGAPDTILFVGRFDRHKGGDVVIKAFDRLAARRPHCRLCFVGPDRGLRDEEGKHWQVHSYARAHLRPSVRARFEYAGFQSGESLSEFRRRAAVVVVPSRYETFGYTALEACALGCPVIVSGIGGLREIVKNGETGLWARPGDPDDLAEQITTLFKHRDLAARLGAAAARDAERRFHPDVIARRTLEFYTDVIGRHTCRGAEAPA